MTRIKILILFHVIYIYILPCFYLLSFNMMDSYINEPFTMLHSSIFTQLETEPRVGLCLLGICNNFQRNFTAYRTVYENIIYKYKNLNLKSWPLTHSWCTELPVDISQQKEWPQLARTVAHVKTVMWCSDIRQCDEHSSTSIYVKFCSYDSDVTRILV